MFLIDRLMSYLYQIEKLLVYAVASIPWYIIVIIHVGLTGSLVHIATSFGWWLLCFLFIFNGAIYSAFRGAARIAKDCESELVKIEHK